MDIKFYLKKDKIDKQGDCPIRVSISSKNVRLMTTTGFKINPQYWDNNRQQVKKNTLNGNSMPANLINSGLDKIRYHFGRLDDVAVSYSKDDLKKEFCLCQGRTEKEQRQDRKKQSIGQLLLSFVTESSRRNGWSESTIKKFKTLGLHLESYYPGAKLSDINLEFISGLQLYYINKGHLNSTITKL